MDFNATFIIAGISFIIFTLIMNKILYRPISDIVAKRQKYLDDNSAVVKENLDKAQSITEEKEQKVQEVKVETKKEVLKEVDNLKTVKTEKEAEKRSEISDKISGKKAELAKEKEKVQNELNLTLDEVSKSIVDKIMEGKD